MAETLTSTTHYHVGHNMPGYLPESDVWTYTTFEDAKGGQIEDMERAADAIQSWTDDHECDDCPCPVYGDDCGWDKANDISAAQQDLNLDSGPEWGIIAGGLSWWITSCTDPACEVDGDD